MAVCSEGHSRQWECKKIAEAHSSHSNHRQTAPRRSLHRTTSTNERRVFFFNSLSFLSSFSFWFAYFFFPPTYLRYRSAQKGNESEIMASMLEFRTPGFNPYAVKYSPYYDSRLAVATSANYGIVGNGRLYCLGLSAAGVQVEKL